MRECLKDEVIYRTSRSSGPGGQHVNKTETRVELLWNPHLSRCLDDRQKSLLIKRLGTRLTGEGILIMTSGTSRSQYQNKKEVTERFLTMVARCMVPRKSRIPTRPTGSSREKRLKDKKYRGEIKKLRGKLPAVAALACLLTGFPIHSQNLDSLLHNKRIYMAVDIGESPVPKIDGELDDGIWSLGEWHGSFTQQQPVGGAPGTEHTYVKVLYDHSNLYVAIICQDSEPERIRDIFDRRDAISGDMTGIAIDSYLDRRTAFEFNLSAAGQKMDLKHLGDYQWDFNWDGVWDGATSPCDSGWIAEMRIPFSQLRYADQTDHVWGMHVWRWIARKFEEDQWQYIPKEAPAMVYLFGNLEGIKNIRGSRQVEFLPYGSGAVEKTAGEGWQKFRPNAGVDAKVGISSDYTLDLSINPDYGQVEADPSVLNLTAFETFFEEKRPFFMEGNDIFDFELDGDIPYYSRRIGSAPLNPLPEGPGNVTSIPRNSTILGAAKLTGKSSGGLNVGLVNGLTAKEYALLEDGEGNEKELLVAPLSNYMATRVKKEFNEGQTIAGAMFSMVNRLSRDSLLDAQMPDAAVSGGVDFLHYWNNRNYFFEMKAIGSRLQGTPASISLRQQSHVHRYQRPDADYLEVDSLSEQLSGHGGLVQVGKKGGNLNFSLVGQYRNPGLDLNDMGYIREADFFGSYANVSYAVNEPGKWIRNYEVALAHEAKWSFGKENIVNDAGINFEMMTNSHWSFSAGYEYSFSHLDTRELRGGPSIRIDGQHRSSLFLSSNGALDLSGHAGMHYQAYAFDGSGEWILHGGLTWLPVRKVKLGGDITFDQTRYHQQYVETILTSGDPEYMVGRIDRQTASLTFRWEVYFTPELSVQYYGSPYFSTGIYDEFKRVSQGSAWNWEERVESVQTEFDPETNNYSFMRGGETLGFGNPDFSFMQFRSNLVLRWEYKLGSTLYLVWAHDRSGWENLYHPVGEITGDLFGIEGNNVFMIKLNFWFSV
jgi:hypothetical protein